MILNGFLMLGATLCAFQALRTKQLLSAALWLACTSALVACLLYALGAYAVAVIELSVGAGLVTVLFVFGISIAGEDAMGKPTLVPWTIAGAVALIAMGLVAWFTLPTTAETITSRCRAILLCHVVGTARTRCSGANWSHLCGCAGYFRHPGRKRTSSPPRLRTRTNGGSNQFGAATTRHH